MKEVIVRLTSDHIKVKGGEYVQDIVRCKDCRWYKDFDGCFFSTAEVEPNHFCAWGERDE